MPAVQNPHWSAWCSWKAALQRARARAPRSCARRSRRPGWRASGTRARARRRAAPCTRRRRPCSQPTFVPVSPLVADEVRQQRPRLDVGRVGRAVDADGDPRRCRGGLARRRGCGLTPAGPLERAARELGDQRAAVVALDRFGGERRGLAGARARRAAAASARVARPRARASRPRACPGASTTAAPASAKSPRVRAYSANAVRAPAGSGGTSIDDQQRGPRYSKRASSAASAHGQLARAGRRARPSRRRSRASASRRGRRGGRPGAAAASARRPATSARAPPGGRSRRSAASPSLRRITPSPAPLMSTSRAGRDLAQVEQRHQALPAREHPRAVDGQRLQASSHDRAATYSNGAGFTAPPARRGRRKPRRTTPGPRLRRSGPALAATAGDARRPTVRASRSAGSSGHRAGRGLQRADTSPCGCRRRPPRARSCPSVSRVAERDGCQASSTASSSLQRPPDLLGGERRVEVAAAERGRQRVGDRGRRADRPALADRP